MTSEKIEQIQSPGGAADNIMRVVASTSDTDLDANSDTKNGWLHWRGRQFQCALGKGGIIAATDKLEGDDATPAGLFALDTLYFRADRMERPRTQLPTQTITQALGWCDDPDATKYNQPIDLPGNVNAEAMWREDHVYDLVISLSHNRYPARPGKGSAIFIHIARDDLSPTRGCIALAKDDLRALLAEVGPETMIRVYSGALGGASDGS